MLGHDFEKTSYESCRSAAQRWANEMKRDFGIERDYFGWRYFMLPQPKDRYGFELRCEVVRPE